jgi:hypothetical protein
MKNEQTISFCMPFHDGGCKRRLATFNLLQKYYKEKILPAFPGSEFVTGGDDTGGRNLNRSRMRNNCAKQAIGDILFFIDADTWLSLESIKLAASYITENPSVGMVQYQKLNWLNDATTAKILETGDFSLFINNEVRDIKSGLTYILRRKDFFFIGGYDESFEGWGYEDTALQSAVRTLLGGIKRVPDKYIAYHFFHPRPRTITQEMQTPTCVVNRELCQKHIAAEGDVIKMRRLIGKEKLSMDKTSIWLDRKIDCYASEEHYAEHMAPLFQELNKRGLAGRFYVHCNYMPRLRGILQDNGFPMQLIEELPSREDALRVAMRGNGAIITSGIGDTLVMKKTKRPNILIEHGAGQSYGSRLPSYIGGCGREELAMVAVPRNKLVQLSKRFYPGIPHSAAGCPKLDWYVNKPHGSAVCISFHWHVTFCPEADYAFPEYRDKLKPLKALCESKGVELIGHCHPRAREVIYPLYRQLGIRIVENFYDVCKESQLYICDNSSTIFEFAALGRPVVMMNSKFYRRSANYGLRFWENTDVGVMVDRPEDLVDIVGKVLDNEVEIDPEAIKRVYNNIGCASKVLADDIVHALGVWANIPKGQESREKIDMVKMVTNRDLMLRGTNVPKGTEIVVDGTEARRLEGFFNKGVAAASRIEVANIQPEEVFVSIPQEIIVAAPIEAPAVLPPTGFENNPSVSMGGEERAVKVNKRRKRGE